MSTQIATRSTTTAATATTDVADDGPKRAPIKKGFVTGTNARIDVREIVIAKRVHGMQASLIREGEGETDSSNMRLTTAAQDAFDETFNNLAATLADTAVFLAQRNGRVQVNLQDVEHAVALTFERDFSDEIAAKIKECVAARTAWLAEKGTADA